MLTPEQIKKARQDLGFDNGQATTSTAAPVTSRHEERMQRLQGIADQGKQKEFVAQPKEKSYFEKIGGALGNFGIGVAKGVGSTVRGALSLTEKGMQTVTRQNVGKETAAEEIIPKDLVTPEGTAQKIGFGTEQIAEFFIPGGAITKTSKVVKGGKLAQLAARSALEAGTVATQTAVQEGELDKDAAIAGGLAGAFPLASKVLAMPFKNVPKSSWAGILKRVPSDVAKNPKLEGQIVEEGVTALSQKGLQAQAGQMIQQIEVQLDDLLQASTEKVKTSAVIDHLNALKEAYAKIPGEKGALSVIDDIGQDVLSKGETLSVLEANQLKRDIYQRVEKTYGKGFMDVPVKPEAQKAVARALKEEIEKVAPEVKDLNERQAIYIQMKKAIEKRMNRESGKGALPFIGNIGLFDVMTGISGAALGATQGGGGKALAYAAGATAVKKITNSTAFLSGLAKTVDYFNSLSPTKKVLFMRGLEGLTSQVSQEEEETPQD